MKPLFPDVIVDGQQISAADIAAEAQNHQAPEGKPGVAWRKAARALVVRKLLLNEAALRGLQAVPCELAPGKIETEEEALIRKLLEIEVVPEPISESDLEDVYKAKSEAFRVPTLYQPSHILIAVPNDELRETARDKAKVTLNEVMEKPRRFSEIAQAHSGCDSKSSGGQLGQVSGGEMVPEFESAMNKAKIGEIFPELIETRFGFHILRLDGPRAI